MSKVLVLSLLAAFSASAAAIASTPAEDIKPPPPFDSPHIVHLTDATFPVDTASGAWLVEFFSPICPHCLLAAPIYTAVAEKYEPLRKFHNFHIASVDCLHNHKLCEKMDIAGYPTFNLYHDGKFIKEFMGQRTHVEFENFIDTESAAFAPAPAKDAAVPPKVDVEAVSTVKKADDKVVEKVNQVMPTEDKASTITLPKPNVDGKVVELTTKTFDSLASKGPWFIEFFAPWCGHCKQLKPHWASLAHDTQGVVNIGSVDCTAETDIQTKYGIRGFPTLKFFYDGVEVADYKGPRDVKRLQEFALLSIKPPTVPVLNENDLKKLIADNAVVFLQLQLYSQSIGYDNVARKNAAFATFAITRDAELLKKYSSSSLVVLKDGKHVAYTGEPSPDAVSEWVSTQKYPSVFELDYQNSNDVFKLQKYVVVIFVDKTSSSKKAQTASNIETLKKVAEKNTRTDIMFAWIDAIQWAPYAEKVFGVTENQLPVAIIVHPDGDEYFTTNSVGNAFPVSVPGLMDAITDAIANRLKRTHIQGRVGELVKFVKATSTGAMYFSSTYPGTTLLIMITFGGIFYLFVYGNRANENRSFSAKKD